MTPKEKRAGIDDVQAVRQRQLRGDQTTMTTITNETAENCERCARLEQKVGDLRSALQLVVATGNLALRYSEELAPPSDDG